MIGIQKSRVSDKAYASSSLYCQLPLWYVIRNSKRCNALIFYQERTLRIVPATSSKSISIQDTANSLGLHDTLEYGPHSLAAEVKTGNGLRERLENVRIHQLIDRSYIHDLPVGGNSG
jgi:hypothetical protein